MSRLIRRFGPQALLLLSAFATAALLALVFRYARIAPMDRPAPVSTAAPVTAPAISDAERGAAQARLAEAMARFAHPAPENPDPPAPPEAPAEAAPEAPAAIAKPVALEAPTVATSPPAATVARPAPSPLSDADMRRLNDKAAQAIRDGDVYGARVILEKSIEGGDAKALMTLAETYDPRGLARMNAKSVKPDPARARALYMQALEKGVPGAKAKLDGLDR